MPIFKYNSIEINFLTEGIGEPIVFISGIGQKMSGWNFQIPFFKRKMRVITLDNRGVGKSSRPNYPYRMEMFVDDVKNLLDYLDIKEKIHLCGHSLGGMIAQHFALDFPEMVSTLILCATAAYINPSFLFDQIKPGEQKYTEERYYKAFLKMIPALYSRNFRKRLKEDKNLFELLKNEWMENPTRAQDFLNQGAAVLEHDTRDLLRKIKQPSLIIASTKDRLQSVRNSRVVHNELPNSELVVLDGLGHLFNVEITKKFNNILWNFIKQQILKTWTT